MRRRVTAAVVALIGLTAVAVLLPAVVRQRRLADRVGCLSRFERLGAFAALYDKPPAGRAQDDMPQAVPPGTVPNPALPPDRRLSWVADLLPLLDQRPQPVADLHARLDRFAAWDDPAHRQVAATRLVLFTAPGAVPEVPPGEPMPTQFVGLSGVGPDSPTLALGPPVPPRAGCFRYDAPTPLRTIRDHDGLSHTALFAETASDLGPWIRGGFSTVRGLSVDGGAKAYLGAGGQFGGNYPGFAGFGFADGSARWLRETTAPAVLTAMFTLAGAGFDPLPGE